MFTRAHDGIVGDDDPAAKPTRRRYSAEFKLAILDEYERLTDPGAKGALLRREGLYSSHIVEWRRARDVGAPAELEPKSRPARRSSEQVELDRARKKIERLENDLAKHKLALEIGKSIGALTLDAAYTTKPAQFRHCLAKPPKLPTVAWINEPTEDVAHNT